MATHIPIYLDGDRTFVDDSWFADLDLARRFFVPHFGELKVIGPWLPLDEANASVMREVGADTPGLSLHPSVDERTRLRAFWPQAARTWQHDLTPLLREAHVVHASVDDPFRPMQLATLRAGFRAGKPTVLIGFDMDVWDVFRAKLEGMTPVQGALHAARTPIMDLWMRHCAKRASVAMLKEGLVYDRYSSVARNPRAFCHSMHSNAQLIDDATFEARLSRLHEGRPLRLGYFGRFVARKGLADAIRILAAARTRGVDASLHLIGDGPQQGELQELANTLGIAEHVMFPGSLPYGDALHDRLRALDALLFTPTEEDTPRMVYDAYAAGLPLITTRIAFLMRRAESDQASVTFDIGDVEAGTQALVDLSRDRQRLADLSVRAREAGVHHTVDNWYGRRVEWTLEAVERHERGVSLGQPSPAYGS